MKILLTAAALALLTGCGLNPVQQEFLEGPRYGDAPGDPCFRCGEDWIFLPNERFAAQKGAARQGFEWGDTHNAPRY
jgi:hypothetical protein